MYCKGILIYKGIEKRDKGVFTNDKGKDIEYDSAYVVKFDEDNNGKINERKVKFPASNKVLFDKFSQYKPYTRVMIIFDVVLGTSACKLVPIDVTGEIEEDEE